MANIKPDKEITFVEGISNWPAPYELAYGLNEPLFESQEEQEIFSSPKVHTGSGAQPVCYWMGARSSFSEY